MKRVFCILIIVFFVSVTEAFSKEWNGIAPGVSTRLEVKKILGKAKPWQGEVVSYQLKNSTVYISYEFRKDNFYSDRDIVKMISISPDNRGRLLSSYTKKLPNFRRDFVKIEIDDSISHVHGKTRYINFAEGFEIAVLRDEKTDREYIIRFSYYPPNSKFPLEVSNE